MANPVDGNNVPMLRAALNTDGVSIINIAINPTGNLLKTANGTTGSNYGTTNAQRDANHNPVLIGVSSADGITPIEIYATSSGQLLTKST